MFRRILAITAAAAILPALTAAASSPSGAASSGVTVATGTITSSSGAAMPGVTVKLYAWPSDAVLSAMKPGQQVPTTLLATTTTSATGTYTLQVPHASLKAAAVNAGYANLEVGTAVGFWFFPYQTGPAAGQPSVPVTVNLGQNSKWACGYDSQGRPYGFSGFRLERTRAPAWAVVGQGYIIRRKHTKGDWLTFKYTQGASQTQASALGVGISGYGFDAGYTSAGSHTSTATHAEGYPRYYGNSWFRTMFKTGQYRGVCYGLPDQKVPHLHQHGQCPKKYGVSYVHKCLWLIHSRGWFGGATTLHPRRAPHTPGRYCAEHGKGTYFEGDYGTALQWSHGFELGAALDIKGVDLKARFNGSAQTGYDTNAVMHFKFHHKGYLCGTNGSEASAAILVQRADKAPR
jgi:hypothetical protein